MRCMRRGIVDVLQYDWMGVITRNPLRFGSLVGESSSLVAIELYHCHLFRRDH